MSALLGIVIAVALWWLLKTFGRADPKALARLSKAVGGVAALGVAALLMLRGRLDMAALAGGVGAWLLGWSATPPGWLGRVLPTRAPAAGAPVSRARSAMIELSLDHGSGSISGTVLAGRLAGRPLDGLDLPALLALRDECLARDVEGAELVEAYLDRRFSGWREHAHRDADRRGRADAQRDAMTEQEAYEVLGLQPGEGADAIRAAHRSLMKKLHPDQGGSTYLASRVNQAKDVLLDRHR